MCVACFFRLTSCGCERNHAQIADVVSGLRDLLSNMRSAAASTALIPIFPNARASNQATPVSASTETPVDPFNKLVTLIGTSDALLFQLVSLLSTIGVPATPTTSGQCLFLMWSCYDAVVQVSMWRLVVMFQSRWQSHQTLLRRCVSLHCVRFLRQFVKFHNVTA